jgi:hypothetical protein
MNIYKRLQTFTNVYKRLNAFTNVDGRLQTFHLRTFKYQPTQRYILTEKTSSQ